MEGPSFCFELIGLVDSLKVAWLLRKRRDSPLSKKADRIRSFSSYVRRVPTGLPAAGRGATLEVWLRPSV